MGGTGSIDPVVPLNPALFPMHWVFWVKNRIERVGFCRNVKGKLFYFLPRDSEGPKTSCVRLPRNLDWETVNWSRVARLALLEPKNRNVALLRSTWLQNFMWLFGYFLALLQHFLPQIFLGEELRVVRVACLRHHKTRSGPPYTCVMLNEHPNIPKKR